MELEELFLVSESNEICPRCRGCGTTERRDRSGTRLCPTCDGSGRLTGIEKRLTVSEEEAIIAIHDKLNEVINLLRGETQ